jgi:hypothetical protein
LALCKNPEEPQAPEVEMFQNDWYLKREAEERIKSRLRTAEANRLARLASETQPHAYQLLLVRLGNILIRMGDYLQTHFSAGMPVEANRFTRPGSAKDAIACAAPSIHRFDCP